MSCRARELDLPIWPHAGHTGISEPTRSGHAGCTCWCTSGEDFLITGRQTELCWYPRGWSSRWGCSRWSSFLSVYTVHQREMNTRVGRKRSDLCQQRFAWASILHLRVQSQVDTFVCQNQDWSGGWFLVLLSGDQGHHCILNFLLLYHCLSKTL